MRKVNPEYAKAIMAIANRAPYLKLLGMKICELDMATAVSKRRSMTA